MKLEGLKMSNIQELARRLEEVEEHCSVVIDERDNALEALTALKKDARWLCEEYRKLVKAEYNGYDVLSGTDPDELLCRRILKATKEN